MTGKTIKVGRKTIGQGHPVFIVAEAGVNHNGNMRLAKRMINVAKQAGADAIKFQSFLTEEMVIPNAPKAKYQDRTVPGQTQYQMLKRLELSVAQMVELKHYCDQKKIVFLSTPFDQISAQRLNDLGVPLFKISSGELTNFPLLEQIARYGKPIIISTGMSSLAEVRSAVRAIQATGNSQLILLHCTSNYPTAFQDVNLRAMVTLRDKFALPTGYSDHTPGIEVSIAAVALGAQVIEKHFTLNKSLPGPDHQASLDPKELIDLILAVRRIESALGDGIKRPQRSEHEIRRIARKSIVASRDIPKGARISLDMLAVKRPGTGISPKYLVAIVGKRTNKLTKKNVLLRWGSIL